MNFSLTSSSQAQISRSLWLWDVPSDPFSSSQFIDTPQKTSSLQKLFKSWKIGKIFLSYRGASDKKLAEFIKFLHFNKCQVYLLLSETSWIDPKNEKIWQDEIDKRLIQYNKYFKRSDAQFDGLSLDIEPHIAPDWKDLSSKQKWQRLENFRTMLNRIRQYLNKKEARYLPIHSTLPAWFDNLPSQASDSNNIGWPNSQARNNFFSSLKKNLMSISLMTFEQSRIESIFKSSSWERENYPGLYKISLRANLGAEWKSQEEFLQALSKIEAQTHEGIDIQSTSLLLKNFSEISPHD